MKTWTILIFMQNQQLLQIEISLHIDTFTVGLWNLVELQKLCDTRHKII